MIDHDRLFKELLTTFFWDFLVLFVPDLAESVDRDSVHFMDKEVFTDVLEGDRYEADLLAKARIRGQDAFILIHLEHQAQPQANFDRRMFRYFARLYENHGLTVYPIALFSFPSPRKIQPAIHRVSAAHKLILEFHYDVIQLNRLNWRDFLEQHNPVAAALMSRMKIPAAERLRVKVECLRLMATLRLNPAKMRLISGFVDTYLKLNPQETQQFQAEVDSMEPRQREAVMQIVTSWLEEGLQQGLQQGRQEGRQEGQCDLLLRLLRRRLGLLPQELEAQVGGLSPSQIEALGEALFDFDAMSQLASWLASLKHEQALLLGQLREVFGALGPDMERQVGQLGRSHLSQLSQILPQLPTLEALQAWLQNALSPSNI